MQAWKLEEELGLRSIDARGANWREESCLSTSNVSTSVNPGAPRFHLSKLLRLGHYKTCWHWPSPPASSLASSTYSSCPESGLAHKTSLHLHSEKPLARYLHPLGHLFSLCRLLGAITSLDHPDSAPMDHMRQSYPKDPLLSMLGYCRHRLGLGELMLMA